MANEPKVTIRVEGTDGEKRFRRPIAAARYLLSLCSAEELQRLKLDGLRDLQQLLDVVTHEKE